MKAHSLEKLQGHRVTPAAILFAIGLIPLNAFGQQNVYWRHDTGTNLWWDDSALPWHYDTWNSSERRPDIFPIPTRNYVKFDNNNQLSTNVNGAFFQMLTLTLEEAASGNRTFTASQGGGISISESFTSDSGGTHTFNVPIGVDGATVGFAVNTGSVSFANSFFVNGNIAAFSGAGATSVSGVMSGTGGSVSKSGDGVLTLSGENTYSGGTSVTDGSLLVNNTSGSGTGSGSVSVGSTGTLGGSGTIGGATTINGTHAAGNNGIGQQTFSSTLEYGATSIFEWEIDLSEEDENVAIHDSVVANAVSGSSVEFKILLASGDSFADPFWNTTRNWTAGALFGPSNQDVNLATLFNDANTTTNFGANSTEGLFTFTGIDSNTLTWTPVPEPSSALAGLLVAAGMMRRRRPM